MKELSELIDARRRARHVPHAVATVLRVEGSSYRRPGARMLIDVHGRVAGSVSGGCLEKSVIASGQAALLDGKPRLLSFDTTDQDDLAFGTSLGCEGKIWIGLELLAPGERWALETIVDEVRERRRPAALLTKIDGADEAGPIRFNATAMLEPETNAGAEVSPSLPCGVQEVFRERKTRFEGRETLGSALIEWLGPPVALLLFGGGPDVPPMVKLARELGHRITVIDRRPDFAVPDAFPGADRVISAKPHEIGALLSPDERTAAVLMNHHYDTDRDVLAALRCFQLPYIAMLGPKRRTERILEELTAGARAIPDEMRATIHGPAGLDIGAETPEQIALSILAEIQATLTGRIGGKLRQRQAPIHVDLRRENKPCPVPA